jgi:hypothetical protein
VTSQSINILPGRVTPLRSALPGFDKPSDVLTFVNQDTANSVWINSDPSVAPNNGALLGPGAVAQWHGAAWGCLDTGVATAVNLLMSTDIDSLDNPQTLASLIASNLSSNAGLNATGIAAALAVNNALTAAGVAAQIATQGTKVNQTSTVLLNVTNQNANPGGLLQIYRLNVAAYQSIACYVDTIATAVGDILSVVFESWSGDPNVAGSVPIDIHTVTIAAQSTLAGNPGVNIKLPVIGPWLKITIDMSTSGTGVNFDMYVVGTTQPITRPWVRAQQSATNYGMGYPAAIFDSNGVPSVPISSTRSYYLAPVAESIRVAYPGTLAASGKIVLSLYTLSQKGWRNLSPQMANVVNTGANGGDQAFDIQCPWGQALRLDIQNLDTTVGRMPVLALWDTSTE